MKIEIIVKGQKNPVIIECDEAVIETITGKLFLLSETADNEVTVYSDECMQATFGNNEISLMIA